MQAIGDNVSPEYGLHIYLAVSISKHDFDIIPKTGFEGSLYYLVEDILLEFSL